MKKKNTNIISDRLVRSYVTSVISISLVLVLVAVALIFAANARNVSDYFKENMAVSVILKQSASDKEAAVLCDSLSSRDYVKDSRLVSKEEGAKEMEALLGEDFLDVFASSPIPVSIDLHLDGQAVTRDSLNYIRNDIMENPIVEEVVYQETLVETLNSNLRKIGLILAVLTVLLLAISFTLINNTVRLNIYARRFTIHTMSLVGAKRSLIARPFVVQAVIQGAVSGLLACGVTAVALYCLNKDSGILSAILDRGIVAASLVGVVALGILICVVSALVVVNRVAYLSKDDLYY